MSRVSMMRSKVTYCVSGWSMTLSSCAPLECCAIIDINDAGVTCVSWVMISSHTDPWSPFTSIANLPAYSVRNEHSVHTAGIFSCNSSSFYSYNNTGRTRPGTCQASATCAQLHRRLQQLQCCDVRDGTVPGTLRALWHRIRLWWHIQLFVAMLWRCDVQ